MMIIDFHTHFYPDKIVERALAASAGVIDHFTAGTREALLDSMRTAGIDRSLGLALANNPANSSGINRWAVEQNHGAIVMTGTVHPAEPDPLETLRRVAGEGLPGIKVHPEYQDFTFDDERLFPVWELCETLGLFLLTHAGWDAMFQPPYHTDPARLATFHRRFPGLKLILAHLGSMAMWDEVEAHLTGLPLWFDLAMASPEYIGRDQLKRIIRAHGAERVLFGTDSPWYDQRRQVDFIRGLGLTPAEEELIFHRNAAGLLGLT